MTPARFRIIRHLVGWLTHYVAPDNYNPILAPQWLPEEDYDWAPYQDALERGFTTWCERYGVDPDHMQGHPEEWPPIVTTAIELLFEEKEVT